MRIARTGTSAFLLEQKDNALLSLFSAHVERAVARAAGDTKLAMFDLYGDFDASVRRALDSLGASYVRSVARAVDDEPHLGSESRLRVLRWIAAGRVDSNGARSIGADVAGGGGGGGGGGRSLLDEVLADELARLAAARSGADTTPSSSSLFYDELQNEQEAALGAVLRLVDEARSELEEAAYGVAVVENAYESAAEPADFAVALDDYVDKVEAATGRAAAAAARAEASTASARRALIEKLGARVPAQSDARKLGFIEQLEARVAAIASDEIGPLRRAAQLDGSRDVLWRRLVALTRGMAQFDEAAARKTAGEAAARLARLIEGDALPLVAAGDEGLARAIAAAKAFGNAAANALFVTRRLGGGGGGGNSSSSGSPAAERTDSLPPDDALLRIADLSARAVRDLRTIDATRSVDTFDVDLATHDTGALIVRGADGVDRVQVYVVLPVGADTAAVGSSIGGGAGAGAGAEYAQEFAVWLRSDDRDNAATYTPIGGGGDKSSVFDRVVALSRPEGALALVFSTEHSLLLRGRRFAISSETGWLFSVGGGGGLVWPVNTDGTPKRPGFDVRLLPATAGAKARNLRIGRADGTNSSDFVAAGIDFGAADWQVFWAPLATAKTKLLDADGADAFAFPALLAATTDAAGAPVATAPAATFVATVDLSAASVGARFQLVRLQPSEKAGATVQLGLRSVPVLVEVRSDVRDV